MRPDEGPFFNDEGVFYKRGEYLWRGPATVIGQDRKHVFLRHGGQVVRVHPSKLKRRRDYTEPMRLPEKPCSIAQGYTDQLGIQIKQLMSQTGRKWTNKQAVKALKTRRLQPSRILSKTLKSQS